MKIRSGLALELCTTKEMHMIRHDNIASDRPAMAIMRSPPFSHEYRCNVS